MRACFLGVTLWMALWGAAFAQPVPADEAGVRLLEQRRYAEAAEVFAPRVAADPDAYVPGHGPAVLLLGRAYEHLGRHGEAAAAYEAGLRGRLDPDGLLLPSPPLVSAYARAVAGGLGDPLLLQRAYLAAVAAAGRIAEADAHGDAEPGALLELERHLLLVASLGAALPEAPAERGPEALAWWDEQDPLPADELNPRLAEHLRRVAIAQRDYPSTITPTGLDDRGATFVRYGEPRRERRVRLDQLPQGGFRALGILPHELPDNEVWLYDTLDANAVFLFVQQRRRGEGYLLGGVNDLLPRPTRTRGTVEGGRQSENFAQAGLSLLAFAFQELALLHPSYAGRAHQLNDYTDWVFAAEDYLPQGFSGTLLARPARREALLEGLAGGSVSPSLAMGRMVDRNRFEDERIRARRDAALPPDYVPELEGRVRPLHARAARLLDAQGRTRVRLLWDGRPLTEFEVGAAEDGTAVERVQHARLVRLLPEPGRRQLVLDTVLLAAGQPLSAVAPLGGGTLALQLDEVIILRDGSGGGGDAGFDGGSGVWRSGPLSPLGQGPGPLDVSDLVPFEVTDVVTTGILLREAFDLDAFQLTPARSLEGRDALGVYFEVYALGPDGMPDAGIGDSMRDYLIEYEVVARREGSLFRRSQERSQTLQSLRTAEGWRRPAAFLIDRAQWEGADEVEVTVTVSDPDADVGVTRRTSFRVRG